LFSSLQNSLYSVQFNQYTRWLTLESIKEEATENKPYPQNVDKAFVFVDNFVNK